MVCLAVCLYILGKCNYHDKISEMTGFGVATTCQTVNEVSVAILNNLWDEAVTELFPHTVENFRTCMGKMNGNFPFVFGTFISFHFHLEII